MENSHTNVGQMARVCHRFCRGDAIIPATGVTRFPTCDEPKLETDRVNHDRTPSAQFYKEPICFLQQPSMFSLISQVSGKLIFIISWGENLLQKLHMCQISTMIDLLCLT